MKLTVGKIEISLEKPVVMAIVNVTPDSFFSGSRTQEADAIERRVRQAVSEGAAILDVGGYSSRQGADDVSPREEFRRLASALEIIRKKFPDTAVSIDTFRAGVMEKTLENFGPCIVNDITGAEAEPEIAGVAARYRVPFIAMHMRGTPQNMQSRTHYDDLIGEIRGYFAAKTETLRSAGVEQIVLDPGFGFSKTVDQNFMLLGRMGETFRDTGLPFLAGISRKSMIYRTLDTTPDDALTGTSALHWECLRQGASILRVHDVREAAQVIALWNRFTAANTAKP